jgi:hypothetical protein
VGRPSKERDKAKEYILAALARSDGQTGNDLSARWESEGGNGRTFWRAVEDLEKDRKIVTRGGPGTRTQKTLHLVRPDAGDSG